MTLLNTLTLASVILAGLAVVLMLVLVLFRWLRYHQHQQEMARRDQLVQLALEYLEEPEFIPAFRAQLKPLDQRVLIKVFSELLPKVRGDYAKQVMHLMRELGLLELCQKESQASQWWRRAEACRVLRHFDDSKSLPILETALKDPQHEVSLEAARALVQRGAKHTYRRILERFASTDFRQSLAVNDLIRSLSADAIPELLAILSGSHPSGAKRLAMDALAHLGHLPAVEPILHLTGHPEWEVRASALQALGSLTDPRSLSVVIAHLHDPVWEVRAQAARSAGLLGATTALTELTGSMEDEHWWVRYYAGEALIRIGEQGQNILREIALTPGAVGASMAMGLLREKGLM